MIQNISVVVLAKNNEITILQTLQSLKDFDDIVVYDNGSTDKTIDIVKQFDNVNLIQGEFKGFGWTKNQAVKFAKHDWIIVIDSDEVIGKKLLQTLRVKKLDKHTVYMLNSRAFYKNIEIKHCGWNNQKVKRVHNKKITHYNNNNVHEDIMTDGLKIELLAGDIKHYSYQSIEQFVNKANTYSTLFAKDNAGRKKSSPLKAIANGFFSFFKTYFLKRGFLDGYVGLIIAFSHMVTNFYKYIKLYELNKALKKK